LQCTPGKYSPLNFFVFTNNPELEDEADDGNLQFNGQEITPELENGLLESAAVHDEMNGPPGKNHNTVHS